MTNPVLQMILANEASRESYEERAAIIEYDANHPRFEAERLALEMMLAKGRRWS
jgi:hypothetical protein